MLLSARKLGFSSASLPGTNGWNNPSSDYVVNYLSIGTHGSKFQAQKANRLSRCSLNTPEKRFALVRLSFSLSELGRDKAPQLFCLKMSWQH